MKKREILALGSITLLCVAAPASAHDRIRDRLGSNSFSSHGRGEDSPPVVTMPPNGYPNSSMQAGGDQGGNGFTYSDHIDRSEWEADQRELRNARAHREARRNGWHRRDRNTDRTVYESAAPENGDASVGSTANNVTSGSGTMNNTSMNSANNHFVYYGEDLPALKGLQLEMAINRLHHLNRMEIDLAKMAESRAKDASVLNMAHRIRADHERMEARVVALAHRRNVKLEGFQLATYEQSLKDRLQKLNGNEFEAAFLRVMEKGHIEAAQQLRMVRNDVADTEVRGLINEALPEIAAHSHLPNKARASMDGGDLGE